MTTPKRTNFRISGPETRTIAAVVFVNLLLQFVPAPIDRPGSSLLHANDEKSSGGLDNEFFLNGEQKQE